MGRVVLGISADERKRSNEETDGGDTARMRMEEKKGAKRDQSDEATDATDEQPKKAKVCGLEVNQEMDSRYGEWAEEDYADEKTGENLDFGMVNAAREEEVTFMKKILLYDEVWVEECREDTGKAIVSAKWVDLNKGSQGTPDVRCRWVARDFKPKGDKDREDLFAAMPPLEAK